MSNERTLTHAQILAAFVEWEEQRRNEPESYGFEGFENETVERVAMIQADYVFELVDKQGAQS